MSKLIRILGMAMVLSALLVVSVAGTIFAADGPPEDANQGEVSPAGDCIQGDCEPNYYDYYWNYYWNYNYSYYYSPGPQAPYPGDTPG